MSRYYFLRSHGVYIKNGMYYTYPNRHPAHRTWTKYGGDEAVINMFDLFKKYHEVPNTLLKMQGLPL